MTGNTPSEGDIYGEETECDVGEEIIRKGKDWQKKKREFFVAYCHCVSIHMVPGIMCSTKTTNPTLMSHIL